MLIEGEEKQLDRVLELHDALKGEPGLQAEAREG